MEPPAGRFVPVPVSVSVPGRRGECEESAPYGRAIFGDFGTTLFLKKCLRPEISKGGNLPTAADCGRGRSSLQPTAPAGDGWSPRPPAASNLGERLQRIGAKRFRGRSE